MSGVIVSSTMYSKVLDGGELYVFFLFPGVRCLLGLKGLVLTSVNISCHAFINSALL
jgi:hypothetical protein